MNSKKGKKSRGPKPSPPQNVDTQLEDSKLDEHSVEKLESELKCDEKGVEAVVTVSDPPPVEDKQDTPKKPKRNRGKKKKQDKDDDFPENPEETIQETVESKPIAEPKVMAEPQVTEPIDNVPEVTPTTRKNKNKKKDKHIEPVPQEKETKGVLVSEENTPSTSEIPSLDIKEQVLEQKEETLPPIMNIDDQEFKTPKKKNKKKKRQDSEKSEHTEEPVSCTTAFQKILNTEEEKIEIKPDVAVEDPVKGKEESKEVANLDKTMTKDEVIATIVIKDQQQETKREEKDETKSKKKNKKEKKHPPKTDTDTSEDPKLPTVPQPQEEVIALSFATLAEAPSATPLVPQQQENIVDLSSTVPAEVTAPTILPEIADNVAKPADIQPLLEAQDISPKPKAKIAKPVEKKKKGKEELKMDEQKADELKNPQIETAIQEIDILPLTADVRDKPLLEPEIKQKHVIEKDVDTCEIKDHIKKPSKGKGKHSESKKKCEDLKQQEIKIPLPEPVLIESKDDVAKPEIKGEVNVPKSSTEVRDLTLTNIDNKTKTSDKNKDKDGNIKDTENQESTISDDIEISSVKTDEIESIAEAVPDVHYPRAASQQLLDDNNNMVIQEIADSFKLDLPVFTGSPVVQGSGETPVDTPDVVAPGITVKEISPEIKEEKTDLKSKMMEVNQDMEELRLSIEKSLAELTALEKTDDEKPLETENKNTTKAPVAEPASIKIETTKTEEKSKSIPDSLVKEFTTKGANTSSEPTQAATSIVLTDEKPPETEVTETPPVCPARKDNKGKGKHKKKGKHDSAQSTAPGNTAISSTATDTQTTTTASSSTEKGSQQETKKEEKSEQKTESTQEKGKQQSDEVELSNDTVSNSDFEPIENFEDALTSSVDDVNKTFEMIVNDNDQVGTTQQSWTNPEINIIAPEESHTKEKDEKINPVSQPKNLLGHTDIPVSSSKVDYKKEKDKSPNMKQAKVKIRDSVAIENGKQSKESQTENKRKLKIKDTFSQIINKNEEYIYKYSFRKVFLPSSCHVCKKDVSENRLPCNYCSLVFYCGAKHKCDDWPEHQALCFAVSTIVHLRNQKHIYADALDATGYDYRVLRMQMILSCEKVMKRRLAACEQEMLLYPRVCANSSCREWRQGKLKDCQRCGQIAFCSPEHLPASHARWCTSYDLYRKLVTHQQTQGRLEPKLPTRVMTDNYQLPEKMNEVLAAIYEEKIDMNDIQYAALTQVATAPLTAAFAHQLPKKSSYVIHVVNAELQFEADALNKWETFFLHIQADVKELTVVLIGTELNPSSLPLELLGKIQLCDNCRLKNRRVLFSFQDKMTYNDYRRGEDFLYPDLVCAFNASIYRTSSSTIKNQWPEVINSILTLKCPFVVTSYTMTEAQKDLRTIIEYSKVPYEVLSEPKYNSFASVRPDRNFISDDEIPLLFKNYCFFVVCGV